VDANELAVIIRPLTSADAVEAARLSGELGYPVPVETMRVRLDDLGSRRDHALFAAYQGARMLGWIHVADVRHLQAEPRAEIGGLVVTADSRSLGIGARLVARAEEWAREHDLPGMLVRSQVMREDAHRFYLREGYSRTKTSAVFSKLFA
jgi:PhnO protein